MVELQDLFPQFELLVGMGSILVSCATGCASLFPEFELFVGMGSILVSCSTGSAVDFPSLFPEFELFVGMGSILVSCPTGNMVELQALLTSRGSRNIGGKSSLGRYVFGSEISYNKAPPRLPGLGC
jgi:hypothetical protein